MYPILGPGTPDPFDPGRPPSTQISPEFSLRRPTMHDNKVVFPQPDAPKSPYLGRFKKKFNQRKVFQSAAITEVMEKSSPIVISVFYHGRKI